MDQSHHEIAYQVMAQSSIKAEMNLSRGYGYITLRTGAQV